MEFIENRTGHVYTFKIIIIIIIIIVIVIIIIIIIFFDTYVLFLTLVLSLFYIMN